MVVQTFGKYPEYGTLISCWNTLISYEIFTVLEFKIIISEKYVPLTINATILSIVIMCHDIVPLVCLSMILFWFYQSVAI